MDRAPPPPTRAAAPPPPTSVTDRDYESRYRYRFSLVQLCEMFKITRPTVLKMIGDTPPAPSNGRRGKVFDILDIAVLEDVRLRGLVNRALGKPNDLPLELDEDGNPLVTGSATQIKAHYQAKDVEQQYLMRKMKNDIALRNLLPADEVERLVAQAFKGLATFVDNIPDILERGGIIDNKSIPRVIEMTDKIRNQLAEDMMKIGDSDHADFDDDHIDPEYDEAHTVDDAPDAEVVDEG